MHTFCRTWDGISLKLTSFVSFSANWPGPDSIALIVPGIIITLSMESTYYYLCVRNKYITFFTKNKDF